MIAERISQIRAALLGRSAYQAAAPATMSNATLDSEDVERVRRAMGGQLALQSYTQTRWYLSDLETAELLADGGDMTQVARLMRASRRDGRISGVLSTRTGGLVRLPKRFRGDPEVVSALEVGHDQGNSRVRSVFDEMCPPSELALLAADGLLIGVGVAELVPVDGRDYPVLVRLDPEFLLYRWNENRWYYRSIAGVIPITPGDGRWVLHCPGGRMSPWHHGLWKAIGRAYIRKEHAQLHKDNYEGKLANPARVAYMPQGSSESQKLDWFKQVMAWGINSVFALTPGYEVKLLESNGRGWEAFDTTITEQNAEIVITIAGQTVTVDGGAGFQNSDIHKTIRADLIKETADGLAYTMNTQVIPPFVAGRYGEDAINDKPCVVEWDVTPPKDRNSEATSMVTVASAITQLTQALSVHGREPDIEALCARFAVPARVVKPDPEDVHEAAGDIQTTTLNGAQITSLLEVIGQVVAGQLPRESAVVIIQYSFALDREIAEEMLGEVGDGFIPASVGVEVNDIDPDADADADAVDDAEQADFEYVDDSAEERAAA